jgi:hypothetical protein
LSLAEHGDRKRHLLPAGSHCYHRYPGTGIKKHDWRTFSKGWFPWIPLSSAIMIPVEIVGCLQPFALSIRLFANGGAGLRDYRAADAYHQAAATLCALPVVVLLFISMWSCSSPTCKPYFSI